MATEVEFNHGPFGTFTKAVAFMIALVGISIAVVLVALGMRYFKDNDNKILTKIEYVMRQVVGLGDLERKDTEDLTATVKNGDQRVIDHVDANGSKIDKVDSHISALDQKLASLEMKLANVNVQKYGPGEYRSSNGNVIKRQVTVFNSVNHGDGSIVTAWQYKDGEATEPENQWCYYFVSAGDSGIDIKINLAVNGKRIFNDAVRKVPQNEEAVGKCQWFGGRISSYNGGEEKVE